MSKILLLAQFIFLISSIGIIETKAQSSLLETFEPSPGQQIIHFRYLRKNCWKINGMSYRHSGGIDSASITTGALKNGIERSITTGNVFIDKGNLLRFKYRLNRMIPVNGYIVMKVSALSLEGSTLYSDSVMLSRFDVDVKEHVLMFPRLGFAKIKISFRGEKSGTVTLDDIEFEGRYLQCQACLPIAEPQVQDVSRCGTGPIFIPAPGGNLNEYRWFDANMNVIPNQNGAGLNTTITSDQTFYVSILRAGCESPPAKVMARVIPQPNPPTTVISGNRCGQGSVVLQATGAEEGSYRWFETSNPNSIIAGATGSTFVTPHLDTSRTYWVGVANGSCLSWRKSVAATITNFNAFYTVEPITPTLNKYRAFPTGANYQWYSGNDSIPGAIWSQLNTGLPDIAVRVTINNCPRYYPHQPGARFAVAAESENHSFEGLHIYPNPANDVVYITGEIINPSTLEISIFDALGRLVFAKKWVNHEPTLLYHKIDIRAFKSGLYTVVVNDKASLKSVRLFKR
jgi:hypothetical protein